MRSRERWALWAEARGYRRKPAAAAAAARSRRWRAKQAMTKANQALINYWPKHFERARSRAERIHTA